MCLNNGTHRANTGDDGYIVATNFFHGIRNHERRDYRGNDGQNRTVADEQGCKNKTGDGPANGIMRKNAEGGKKHGISGVSGCPHFVYQPSGTHQIKRISDAAQENHERPEVEIWVAGIQSKLAKIRKPYSYIGKQQGDELCAV